MPSSYTPTVFDEDKCYYGGFCFGEKRDQLFIALESVNHYDEKHMFSQKTVFKC